MTTNLSDYKNLYMQTAKEYIGNMFESIKKLTDNPKDKDAINNLHIASHSLKSQSQVMGFTDIANICLNIEKMSDDALESITQLNNQIVANIKKSVEELKGILHSVQDDNGK